MRGSNDLSVRDFETPHDYLLYPYESWKNGQIKQAKYYWRLYGLRHHLTEALKHMRETLPSDQVNEFLHKMEGIA